VISDQRSAVSDQRSAISVQPSAISVQRSASRAFVLLEILVSMVILGIALAAVLRCYTNGLRALSHDRTVTQAVLLTQGLLEDFEIAVTEDDHVEGDFGSDFPHFSFVADFETVEIEYEDIDLGFDRRQLEPLRKVVVRIYHQPPNAIEAVRVLRVETYLTGIEKYAQRTKFLNALY